MTKQQWYRAIHRYFAPLDDHANSRSNDGPRCPHFGAPGPGVDSRILVHAGGFTVPPADAVAARMPQINHSQIAVSDTKGLTVFSGQSLVLDEDHLVVIREGLPTLVPWESVRFIEVIPI